MTQLVAPNASVIIYFVGLLGLIGTLVLIVIQKARGGHPLVGLPRVFLILSALVLVANALGVVAIGVAAIGYGAFVLLGHRSRPGKAHS